MFHAACVRAMERFNVEASHLCPCCRLRYHSRPYDEALAAEAAVAEDRVAPVAGRPLELLGDPEDDARRRALWDALR